MDHSKFKDYFDEDYATSRQNFIEATSKMKGTLQSYLICEDCYIDIFIKEGIKKDKALILACGQHGIEGYVGSGIIQYVIDQKSSLFKRDDLCIILIHAMNPWGMKHYRKTNENNVDLNRNFMVDYHIKEDANPWYEKCIKLFEPHQCYGSKYMESIKFMNRTIVQLIRMGMGNVEKAITLGQFKNRKGLYYGSDQEETSTKILKVCYDEWFHTYDHILFLDLHTGYGPANQLSIVNSRYEKQTSDEMKKRFDYEFIVKSDANEFYEIYGDEIDYIYQKFKGCDFYAATLEFGTLGNDIKGYVKTLKAIIEENQAYMYGCLHKFDESRILKNYQALYQPFDEIFYQSIQPQFDHAFDQILKTYGYFK